jgi:hypothetical protein
VTSTKKLGAAGLAAALAAGSLAAMAAASPANAASGTTAGIHGMTANSVGYVWFDDGAAAVIPSKPASTGTPRNIEFTATPSGADIDFKVVLSKGPNNSFNPLGAGTYSVDALVRLDGAPNTRGDRYQGPTGAAVGANADVFPGGTIIEGTIPRAGVGTHKVTLTDLVLNIQGSEPGSASGWNLSDPYGGFDTFYNTNAEAFTSPKDWNLSETVVVSEAAPVDKVKPAVKISKPKKKAAKKGKTWTVVNGTISDALSGPDRVEVSLVSKLKIAKKASKKVKAKKWAFFNGKKYKAVKTKKLANKKAAKNVLVAIPGLNGKWKAEPGVKAPKGKLIVKATGYDKDGNKSVKKLSQKVTK